MEKLKIVTVVGTRPEIIRLSRIMPLLDEHLAQTIIHTGQNYDYELNEVFWKDLELRKPDHFLNIRTTTLGTSIGDIMFKTEAILKSEKPDAFLVLGDTNSCLAAYIAKRMHIPIFHMEAGNRCFDQNVPEEINRKIIDHIADFNLVYTEHARRNLLLEGFSPRRINLVGSPMAEVLKYYKPKIQKSRIIGELHLKPQNYFLASIHREENVDNKENLEKILYILNQLVKIYDMPIVVSTHPRTRKRLETMKDYSIDLKVLFMKPFGFYDYIYLQQNSKCVISDSGTISEESSMLSFPAISIRQSMERPEAQDAGSIILTGFDPRSVLNAIKITLSDYQTRTSDRIADDYKIPDTSWRVLKLIQGNAKLSNLWWGIK